MILYILYKKNRILLNAKWFVFYIVELTIVEPCLYFFVIVIFLLIIIILFQLYVEVKTPCLNICILLVGIKWCCN